MLKDKFRKRDGDRVSSISKRELLNFGHVIICLFENESWTHQTNVLQQGRVWYPLSEFAVCSRGFPAECTGHEEALEFHGRLPEWGSVISKVADYNIEESVDKFGDRRW